MTSAFQTFGYVIGFIGAAAFVFAYFKSDVTKKTVAQLKELAETLEMRVKALEDERESMSEKIEHLEQENEVLRSLLDGTQSNDDLRQNIEQNHKELLTLFEKTIETIEKLVRNK